MIKALVLILMLTVIGCNQPDGPCVVWCKNYIGGNSWLKTVNKFTDDTLPIIMGINTPNGKAHAVVVISEDKEYYYYVDNGVMGGNGKVQKNAALGWIRRRQ